MDKPDNNGIIDTGREQLEVEAEQVRQTWSLAAYGIIATVLNSLVVFFVMAAIVPFRALTAWLCAILFLSAVRIAFLARFRSVSRQRQFPVRQWKRRFLAGLVLIGILWGTLGLFPYSATFPAHEVFIAFVLGGMAAGAASSFSLLKGGYEAFSIPALLPLTVRFFLTNDAFHIAMGTMLALYGVLLWRIARYH